MMCRFSTIILFCLFSHSLFAQISVVNVDSVRTGNPSGSGSVAIYGKTFVKNPVPGTKADSILVIGKTGEMRYVKRSELLSGLGPVSDPLKENVSNKQNSLAPDVTNSRYPTVTAINSALENKARLVGGKVDTAQLPVVNLSPTQFETLPDGTIGIKLSYLQSLGLGGGGSGNYTPSAPTMGVVDDVSKTFDWTNSSGFESLNDYEYTLDAGATQAIVVAKPINVNGARAVGQVGVRVRPYPGRNASVWLYNSSAFNGSGSGGPASVVPDKFLGGTFTQTSGQIISTAEARAVVANSADPGPHSTRAVTSIEVGWDASWVGKNLVFGLSSQDYGEGYAGIDFASYVQPNMSAMSRIAKSSDGGADINMYTLPQSATTKLKIEATAGAVYWNINFYSSTDNGSTWTLRRSATSAVSKNILLYGSINALESGMTVKGIRVTP